MGLGTKIDAVDGTPITGGEAVVKYLTGYVVEKSLSVDNIFVIALIFGYFAVPAIYQHRVLFWGILGALVMRGIMIGIGAALIARFHWILYLFAAFLILAAIKMLLIKTESDPGKNFVVRLTKRIFPVTDTFHGEHFFVRAGSGASKEPPIPAGADVPHAGERPRDRAVEAVRAGTIMITPLMLALVMVETTDLIFAVDSIPAIFAITADPFLVFTSNVFAILGLRSLYFALAGMIESFKYLKVALAVVLMVVGVKMLLHGWLKATLGPNFNLYLLGVVLGILATGVIASLIARRRHGPPVEQPSSRDADVAAAPVPATTER
jgi:tellurite resistance protein TerC